MKSPPLILESPDDVGRRLARIDVTPSDPRNEAWLQQLLYSHPELLPVDEFDESFSPPIPIGREVRTDRGPIDDLFVSPFGGITVVETKLWKNPEKHRTVVAQIIDYAKELATWDYDRLCQAILTSSRQWGETERVSLEDKVAASLATHGIPLHEFQEAVAATLSQGNFLLLIVGDRISPNIALLTKAIQSSPGLGFTIGLAEMQLYQTAPGEDWPLLVVPEVLGRTIEQTRGVVRIQYVQEKPTVAVTVGGDDGGDDPIARLNEDLFFQLIPKDLVEPVRKGFEEWQSLGGRIHFTDKMLFFKITLGGSDCNIVRFRSDKVSIVRETEIISWANDSSLRTQYLYVLDSSPVASSHARNSKMRIKYTSLSPADMEVLLRAARELVQQIKLDE